MALSQITWQDVQQLPDDGHRHEAIGGELYVTPAPTPRHQDIVLRLAIRLREILVEPGLGRLWVAPIGVEFPDTGEGVQPDIVFVSTARRDRIVEAGIQGAPDLVVEVLSPTTESRDRGVKRKLYERQGVSVYWIVDPEAGAVEIRTFGEDSAFERFTDRLRVRLGGTDLGSIDLAEVFRAD
jgi:Uma2 family endonuclease